MPSDTEVVIIGAGAAGLSAATALARLGRNAVVIGFEASVMGVDIAVVFTGGRLAVWLEKQGPRAGRDYALDQVAGILGNNVRRRVTRSIRHRLEHRSFDPGRILLRAAGPGAPARGARATAARPGVFRRRSHPDRGPRHLPRGLLVGYPRGRGNR